VVVGGPYPPDGGHGRSRRAAWQVLIVLIQLRPGF